ncbi:hypothetical protein WMF31_41600 [Sorangium sp. So ce1036]|uniref:hypothetical protein n=1 Tax=Sorangium sp. So ce1036 TaxID=3133328 RepID=UPI003F023EBA
MNVSRRLWIATAAGALLLGPGALGCSSTPAPKTATVEPGDMPEGGDWTGVYYSELYGYLHLVHDGNGGNGVEGRWIRPVKDRWGELHGTATGDLIKFTWTEHTIGAIGPNASRSGRGYFKYQRPEGENVDDRLVGEIGRNKDEVGEPWEAIKQRNMLPDLQSIGGSGASEISGGDWDTDNQESGEPEPPAEPEAEPPSL